MKYGNKEIEAMRAPMGNHYVLAFTTGGELPKELGGLYTSQGIAFEAVATYLDSQSKSKGKPSANSSGK